MFDTQVTVQGWVGGPVTFHEFDGEARLAKFRLGSTPRMRRDGEWVDGETAWYSVRAWGQLGRHVAASVQRGEPVLVTGRLRRSSWTGEDGAEHSDWEIEATAVGHDLNRGSSRFHKPPARSERGQDDTGGGAVDPTGPAAASGGAGTAEEPQPGSPADAWRVPVGSPT